MFGFVKTCTAIGLVSLSGVAAAEVFSNSYDSSISQFGWPDTSNYGQVFTTAGVGLLSSWSFYADAGAAGNVQLVVAGWEGTKAVGPALFTSSFNYAGGAEALSFTDMSLNLQGGSYIAYLSVAGVDNPVTGISIAGSNSNGGMSGGFRYLNSGGANPLSLDSSWSPWGIPNMEYTAVLSPVPEPESYALILAGLGVMGVAWRRRTAVAKREALAGHLAHTQFLGA